MMTLFVTIYMALMGPRGLQEVNEQSYAGAHYLHDQLLKTGKFADAFGTKPFFNEFCVRTHENIESMQQHLIENGILGGIRLCRNNMDDCILFAVTEKRTKEEIDKLVSLIQKGE
jgi:glycine dehydrogenase subunit 1